MSDPEKITHYKIPYIDGTSYIYGETPTSRAANFVADRTSGTIHGTDMHGHGQAEKKLCDLLAVLARGTEFPASALEAAVVLRKIAAAEDPVLSSLAADAAQVSFNVRASGGDVGPAAAELRAAVLGYDAWVNIRYWGYRFGPVELRRAARAHYEPGSDPHPGKYCDGVIYDALGGLDADPERMRAAWDAKVPGVLTLEQLQKAQEAGVDVVKVVQDTATSDIAGSSR